MKGKDIITGHYYHVVKLGSVMIIDPPKSPTRPLARLYKVLTESNLPRYVKAVDIIREIPVTDFVIKGRK